jgi:hypothetical protein
MGTFVVYRPPPAPTATFFDEFGAFLESVALTTGDLLITGDFNIHLDNADNRDTGKFVNLLKSSNLQQLVTFPTHEKGHILDLIIVRSDESIVNNIAPGQQVTDHFVVMCKISMDKPPPLKKTIKFRKIKTINNEEFSKDIAKSELVTNPSTTLDGLVHQYKNVLGELLDKHAPEKQSTFVVRPDSPWYSPKIKTEKSKRRKLERRWRKTGRKTDELIYKQQCILVNGMVDEAKLHYYSHLIQSNETDQKALFCLVDKLLHRKNSTVLPKHDSIDELTEKFSSFFIEKIELIRKSLQGIEENNVKMGDCTASTTLSHFEPATMEEVKKIIMSSPSKTCPLDPIPTSLVKANVDVMTPIITSIINKSLASGEVPRALKYALVLPLLKKLLLDPDILKNFRPVSNLPFISKVTEKVVDVRLNKHQHKSLG